MWEQENEDKKLQLQFRLHTADITDWSKNRIHLHVWKHRLENLMEELLTVGMMRKKNWAYRPWKRRRWLMSWDSIVLIHFRPSLCWKPWKIYHLYRSIVMVHSYSLRRNQILIWDIFEINLTVDSFKSQHMFICNTSTPGYMIKH